MRRRRRRLRGERGPQRAGAPLRALLTRYGIRRELREHRILSQWRQIVGDRIADRTFPDGLSGGILWVRAQNSAWLAELSFLKDDIATRANEAIGTDLVREVRFHLDARRATADDPLAPTIKIHRIPPRHRPLPAPARGKNLERIESETSRIEDPELRQIILETRRKLDL